MADSLGRGYCPACWGRLEKEADQKYTVEIGERCDGCGRRAEYERKKR